MKCTARASLCGESFALAREGDAGTIVQSRSDLIVSSQASVST
jgi:hypothetical protein